MKMSLLVLVFGMLWIGGGLIPKAQSQASPTLRLQPQEALIDEAVKISASSLKPGQAVTLKARMEDRQGQVWLSQAQFVADQAGQIDLTKQAPVSGTYNGIDPMGLIWSLDVTSEKVPVPANASAPSSIIVKFELEAGNTIIATAQLKQFSVASSVKTQEVREQGLIAKLYQPEKGGPHPGILVLGGSEGGISSAEANAALLASRGYAALAVAYFGMEGLPQRLVGVPIDYLKKAIDWMAAKEGIDRRRLAVLGWSKGGELGLLLASQFPELKAAVAYVPSHVVWQGVGGAAASWNYRGEPLAFVPYKSMPSSRTTTGPLNYMPYYLASLDNPEAVEKATIPVEKIQGPVLLISGKDDQLWPSSVMAERVIARLREHQHKYRSEHLAYEQAGHNIETTYGSKMRSMSAGRTVLGGTPAGNARAQSDSWPKVLEFLKDSLK